MNLGQLLVRSYNKSIGFSLLFSFLALIGYSQNDYHSKDYFDPVKFDPGTINIGYVMAFPIDSTKNEYTLRMNYNLGAISLGGGFNWVPNYDTAGYEIEIAVKGIFSLFDAEGIYLRAGPQIRFWANENQKLKPFVFTKGIGMTRNIKFITVFAEFSWEQKVNTGAIKAGLLYNFEKL